MVSFVVALSVQGNVGRSLVVSSSLNLRSRVSQSQWNAALLTDDPRMSCPQAIPSEGSRHSNPSITLSVLIGLPREPHPTRREQVPALRRRLRNRILQLAMSFLLLRRMGRERRLEGLRRVLRGVLRVLRQAVAAARGRRVGAAVGDGGNGQAGTGVAAFAVGREVGGRADGCGGGLRDLFCGLVGGEVGIWCALSVIWFELYCKQSNLTGEAESVRSIAHIPICRAPWILRALVRVVSVLRH